MIDKKILENTLTEIYNNYAHKRLIETKEKLPAEYKGFIDEDLAILKNVYNELKNFDVNFYSLKSGSKEVIIEEFKSHCLQRFNYILFMATPEHIMSYGRTYAQYKTSQR